MNQHKESVPKSWPKPAVSLKVVSKTVVVIKAVNMDGQQEILAVEPMKNESEQMYSALFRKLQERGVEKVWLCVSDAHKGLEAAIRHTLPGTIWQRCYGNSYPKAVECLEEGFEDSIGFDAFEELDSRKISSTHILELLNIDSAISRGT